MGIYFRHKVLKAKGSLKIKRVSWRTALNRTDSVRQMFKEAKDGKKYQLNFPSELDEQN